MEKTQSASTSDQMGDPKWKGQKEAFDKSTTPAGMADLKAKRNTGEIKQGTDYLRQAQKGLND